MLPKLIKHILAEKPELQQVEIKGWVRTKRDMKNLVFVEVYDGSCFDGIQCTFNREDGFSDETENTLALLTTGASVGINGKLVPSPASGQAVEVAAEKLTLLGAAPADDEGAGDTEIKAYPLQKKRHSLEFLREIAHLRPRTNTIGAVMRIRSRLAFAIHKYFQDRDFLYLHTPIITAGDCEGAGEMFQVTTIANEERLEPKVREKKEEREESVRELARIGTNYKEGKKELIDYSKDFFGKKTYLTVSGQLEAETYASALSRVYTFGPTFRAENSNTARHLAEFWMVEPEVAFAEIEDDMALAEDFLKYLFNNVLEECADDLIFFDTHVEKNIVSAIKTADTNTIGDIKTSPISIIENLRAVAKAKFAHITYTDAINELEKAVNAQKVKFEFLPKWGADLQSEHEKYLTEKVAGGPVIVTDYPKEIKAFYMKLNDDNKTVRAMDVLVPRLGEIIGGSQREDNLEKLTKRMKELNLDTKDYWWYLDLRRYGSVPHSGFGLGFERLIQYVTGMANIRDVIPFPRAVGQAEF